ncbi:MAG: ABC transporter permease, partial [Muribaculaceae bacterium]|nr:ABC transporter permease [Muribaculaceae bacterium]
MKSSLSLVISREFVQRVSRKSFIITTILMPVLMLALMVAPALVMSLSTPSEKRIAVVDRSGAVMTALKNTESIKFCPFDPETDIDMLKSDDNYYGVLVVGESIIDTPSDVRLFTHEAASIDVETGISSQLSDIIEDVRVSRYGIADLRNIIDSIHAEVYIFSERIGEEQSASSIMSYALGIAMTFILYMFLLIYGQMVMTGIIEEKNNRVLEIVVSSVKPTNLMLGKIIGIGLVATVQVLIWAILICGASIWVMPWVSTAMAGADADVLRIVAQLGNVGYILSLFAWLLLFLIGGFLFYSSIFAAIGSAVDNIQDASQLTSIVVVPIVLGLVMAMSVVSDPNSAMAMWLSYIPFTSPMV